MTLRPPEVKPHLSEKDSDFKVHLGDVGEDDWKVRTPKKVPGVAPERNVFEAGKVAALEKDWTCIKALI